MKPYRGIVCMYRLLYGLSSIADDQNTLTYQLIEYRIVIGTRVLYD